MEIEVNVTSSKVNSTVTKTLNVAFPRVLLTMQNKRGKINEKLRMSGKKAPCNNAKLFRQICSDKWTDEAQEEIEKSDNLSSSNIRISKTDLKQFVKKNILKPRFHLSALINIIEQDIFDNDEAKNYAIEQKVNLEQKAAKVFADNKESKKRKEKRSKIQSLKLQLSICLRNLRVKEADPDEIEI